MADDYDVDIDDLIDMDGEWLYVEDDYDLADELAEGQLANPGYSGTNYEIDIEAYELDIYGYWDDLEYGDDAYWDYSVSCKDEERTGQKRKRDDAKQTSLDKRHKTVPRSAEVLQSHDREAEPLVFRSREERNARFFDSPPRLENEGKFAFLPDWKQRFAGKEGLVLETQMPAAMKRAAEGQDRNSPPRKEHSLKESGDRAKNDEGEEDWEDDEDAEDDDAQGELGVDPEMLKAILQEKLGAAGLDGVDEEVFMQTLQKMLSGEGDDAAGDLADALLRKVTSNTGNASVSGWLSQQGVSLGEDEDEGAEDPDVAKANVSEPGNNREYQSRRDTVSQSKNVTQMPLHPGSPPAASKKRAAPADANTSRKQKMMKFNAPGATEEQDSQDPGSDNPPMSEQTIAKAAKAEAVNAATTKTNQATTKGETESSTKKSRKRKASTDEASDDKKPTAKKKMSKELESLGAVPDATSPAPPAKRTRSARTKSNK